MSDDDLISRNAALALQQYCVDGLESTDTEKTGFVLASALRALPAVTVGVKPLVWEDDTEAEASIAETKIAFCEAYTCDGGWMASFCGVDIGIFPTLEAAKAAAQADYAARILAALEPQPADHRTVLERCDDGSETVLDWYSGGDDPDGEFGRMGLRREWDDGRVEYRTYRADGPWGDPRPVSQPAPALPDVAALVEAVKALGAMPEGYCFCSANRIGDDSKTHEPECADLRAIIGADDDRV